MISGAWRWLKKLPGTLSGPRLEPAQQAQRILVIQRNIISPARLLVIAAVLFQLHTSRWLNEAVDTYGVVFEAAQNTMLAYACVALMVTVVIYVVRRFPPGAVQWLVFIIGLGDGVFLGALTLLTEGFMSPLYWVYPGIIILNALSIPLATPQIVLNLMLSVFFLAAGLVETNSRVDISLPGFPRVVRGVKFGAVDFNEHLSEACAWLERIPPVVARKWFSPAESTLQKIAQYRATGIANEELKKALAEEFNRISARAPRLVPDSPTIDLSDTSPASHVLRVAVLVLLTFCCYGLQVLVAAQQRAESDQTEFLVRTEQLRGAGRLAAEFAQQIKNPLAIINNAVFSLRRALRGGPPEAAQHLEIIQEEVARADQTITQIMGYAQLSEGRVEKLDVQQELERACEQVLPRSIQTGVQLHTEIAREFPPLLMQRRHFTECVVNLLQNAREAVGEQGHVYLAAAVRRDYAVEVTVRDDGPGIPPDKLERIFEAYYTTKDRGTGLGLAIVKHNVELYNGSVRVESALGQGARFTLVFPAKTLIKLGS